MRRKLMQLLVKFAAFTLMSTGSAALALASDEPNRVDPAAQDAAIQAPTQATPDIEDTKDLETFIDGVMKAHMDSLKIPNAVISIVKDGRVLFAKGYGYADIDRQVPVDPATSMFRIGSITKTLTWTAIMQLVEQGKLDLDADVNTYLEDFKIPDTYPQPITLRHIMTHTTGFEEGYLGYARADPVKDKAIAPLLKAHMPARVRPPGELASYSNYAAALAGLLIEQASGLTYDEYIRRHIFEPLGMQYATVEEVVPEALKPHVVTGYRYRNGTFEPGRFETIGGFRAAGSGTVSALDMARYMIAHLQEGRYGDQRILSPESVHAMQNTVFHGDPRLPGTTLGFYEQRINNVRIIAHGGDSSMFHAYMYLIPEKNIGIFVDYTCDGGVFARDGLMEALFDRYFPAVERSSQFSLSVDEARKAYAGAYKFMRRNYTDIDKAMFLATHVEVSALDGGRLLVSVPALDGLEWQFEPVDRHLFRQIGGKRSIAFRVGEDGRATHMFLDLTPMMALDRTVWYEHQGFWYPLLTLIALILVAALAMPAYRWRQIRSLPVEQRRLVWLPSITGAWLVLTILALAIAVSSSPDPISWRIPTALKVALVMPHVFVVLAVALVVAAVRIWRRGYLSVAGRIHYSLVTLAALVLTVFLFQWNLLGWQFG
ncbi:MAG TPA: serine hydrolase domain-containing protein [Steroidobacter sp.]